MFALSTSHRFELYYGPADMRKGFDGLCGLVINELQGSPDNGCVYIFINRARDKVKLLHWQPGGFVLYYKRLESGAFKLPQYDAEIGSLTLSYTQLILLIDGIAITHITRRKRYEKV